MSEEKKSDQQALTPEEEAQQTLYASQRAVSFQFMRRHLDYKPDIKNVEKMMAWMSANDAKEWTVENLERAFTALRDQLELNPDPVPPAPIEEVAPPPEYEWGVLTKASIDQMPRETYKQFYKNLEFQRQVNNVLSGRGQYE